MKSVTILLGDRILLRADKVKETFGDTKIEKTEATLAEELPNTGEVVYVANDTKFVQVGDKVLFNKHAGIDAEVNGEKLLIMTEGSVWLITEREELKDSE